MSTELPKNGKDFYNACRTCAANVGYKVCDESLLDKFSDFRPVSKYKPRECPKNKITYLATQSPEALLKAQLKR